MKKILIIITIAFGTIGGCGGDSDECGISLFCDLTRCSDVTDFKILDITNGPNAQEANSFWNCTNDLNEEYELSIFADKTGESTEMDINGPFLWSQCGCRSIRIKDLDNFGLGQIRNIQGSSDEGISTHILSLDATIGTRTATCDLVLLVQ